MADEDDAPVRSAISEQHPARGQRLPVVVGIGASAGGLHALKEFVATIPPDSGVAFVVVVHLSPDHESHLADLLQTHCAVPVAQVTSEIPLEPNRVYVIPPGRNLSAVDSHLRLAPLADARTGRAPIDHFFRTLAATHDGSSIGVILSGSGTDGTAGIRYIREHGGMAIAQDPNEAEYDGMARSAIASGSVDRVLPIAAMMLHIIEFTRTQPLLTGISEEAPPEDEEQGQGADTLQTVLTLVRLRTGHDFLRYKRSTVARRIARRMQILNIDEVPAYVETLRNDSQEATTLLDDLLINVTSFFRDPEVFRTLETEVIPSLMEGKARGEAVRVWSVGCATGEEAYTLGMLLLEEAARRPNPPQIQVFATDLHEQSLQFGRDALYSEMIEAEISPERLERFFRRDSGGYRVTKELRDIVVFATHNLLRDPPFSKQDLIVCRNVLIYLQRDVQEEVIDVFHYALRPGGRLLLGTAEILDRSDLFTIESKAAHLYRRRDGHRGSLRFPVVAPSAFGRFPPLELQTQRSAPGDGYGAMHQKMLERYAPPSILVGSDHAVIHLSNSVGRFLQHPGGEPTNNLFKLVREEFRLELRTALHSVRERHVTWRSRPIVTRIDGVERLVILRVSPADEPELEGLMLVIFDEVDEDVIAPALHAGDADARVLEVEAELDTTRARMQALIEEFETSQEEMRAANEELQSANEELRSTMEELETSREELQSVNEELQTLNQENRHKVEELSQLSSDLQNLLQATDVATIFLDRSLRILRYTPRVSDVFNIRHTDRGRPLGDLTHRLGYDKLMEDARRVMQTLVPTEHEVEGPSSGSWYVLRVAPYRTMEDRIEGVVITLVDVSALKETEFALRRNEERQAFLVRLQDATRVLSDPIQIQRAASRLLGEHLGVDRVTYAEIEGDEAVVRGAYLHGVEPLPSRFALAQLGASVHGAYGRGEAIEMEDVQTDPRFTDAERAFYQRSKVGAFASVMIAKNGRWIAAFSAQSKAPRPWSPDDLALIREVGERTWDAVERARSGQALKESEERYRLMIEGALNYAIFTVDHEGIIESWSPGAAEVFGWTADEAVGQPSDITFTPEDRAAGVPAAELELARSSGSAPDRRWHERSDGSRVFIDGATHLLRDGSSGERFVKIGQDVTQRREFESSLRELTESLESRVAERTGQLSRANEARDMLRLQLVQAEEQERAHLARELHDEVAQHLTALGLGLQALSDVTPPGSEVDRRASELRELVAALSREMHSLAMRLRPKALDDFGLRAAIEAYVAAWSQRAGIAADLHVADTERLSPSVESAVYRVVQEALTNVAKHSRATRASVVVERRDGQLVAIVEDNGRGFEDRTEGDQRGSNGLGLLGIHERASLLGGSAQVESTVGGGTTVIVRIPVPAPTAQSDDREEDPRSETVNA